MGPPAAPHRSSRFKPVMIPSDPAHLHDSFTSHPCATHLRPFAVHGAHPCTAEHAALSAPHVSGGQPAHHWSSIHGVMSRGMLSLSDGAAPGLTMMRQDCGLESAAPQLMEQTMAPVAHKMPEVPTTSAISIPCTHPPYQFNAAHPGSVFSAASAPASMPRNPENVDTAIAEDCSDECTLRGGRALQGQLLIHQEGSPFRPLMLRATPSGRSAPRRSGAPLLTKHSPCKCPAIGPASPI